MLPKYKVECHLVCQEGALGLMGDWWLEVSREEAIETLSYGEIGSVDVPWIKDTKIKGKILKRIIINQQN